MRWEAFSAAQLLGCEAANAPPQVIAVVGCGGKTSFIGAFSDEMRHKKVLVSPTTKIRPMQEEDVLLCRTLAECEAHRPAAGVQCLGIQNPATGKLQALPEKLLAKIAGEYDLALLEADGSRGLPCKGWRKNEPVVPPYCTDTIGIVTLAALGKAADETTVLNLPAFTQLTGVPPDGIITQEALLVMVCGENGMFRSSAGRQCLLVNKAEDDAGSALAEAWLAEIKERCPARFAILAYGSARQNKWRLV